MKFRLGFVSNSSSSSFLVAFARIPSSADEVHAMLFPGGPTSVHPYEHACVSSRDAAECVYHDMLNTDGPLKIEEIAKHVRRGSFPGQPKYPSRVWDLPAEERDAALEKYEQESDEAAKKVAEEWLAELGDVAVFHFEYADDDNFGTAMEHGGVFDKLPHLRISHH